MKRRTTGLLVSLLCLLLYSIYLRLPFELPELVSFIILLILGVGGVTGLIQLISGKDIFRMQ